MTPPRKQLLKVCENAFFAEGSDLNLISVDDKEQLVHGN